jgi:hypothetical protein
MEFDIEVKDEDDSDDHDDRDEEGDSDGGSDDDDADDDDNSDADAIDDEEEEEEDDDDDEAAGSWPPLDPARRERVHSLVETSAVSVPIRHEEFFEAACAAMDASSSTFDFSDVASSASELPFSAASALSYSAPSAALVAVASSSSSSDAAPSFGVPIAGAIVDASGLHLVSAGDVHEAAVARQLLPHARQPPLRATTGWFPPVMPLPISNVYTTVSGNVRPEELVQLKFMPYANMHSHLTLPLC